MDVCIKCGKEIRYIRRAGMKSLIVEKRTVFFVPDTSGDMYFIHGGVMRKGSFSPDGLKGSILHNC